MNSFATTDKQTVQFIFDKPMNGVLFEIYDSKGDVYFFRELTGQASIKVNLAKAGKFKTNVDVNTINILPLKIHQLKYDLPPIEKNYMHDNWKFIYNPDLQNTPARNFYRKGVIETGPKFWSLPFPVRIFILCHELGHAYYHDESNADIFGAKLFISKGYNNSTAFYALRNVLNFKSDANKERLTKLFEVLKR